jgi:hypothetical protein
MNKLATAMLICLSFLATGPAGAQIQKHTLDDDETSQSPAQSSAKATRAAPAKAVKYVETGPTADQACDKAKGRAKRAANFGKAGEAIDGFGKCSCSKKAQYVFSCEVEARVIELTTGNETGRR